MNQRNKLIIILLIIVAFFGALSLVDFSFLHKPQFAIPTNGPQFITTEEFSQLPKAKVIEVIDGDTIHVLLENKEETIRYLGIDTPEIEHSATGRTQQFGERAKQLNEFLVKDKNVYLQHDIQKRDAYNRLLAFVYLEDKTLANWVILRSGYAKALIILPNSKFSDLFKQEEAKAIEDKLGIWSR